MADTVDIVKSKGTAYIWGTTPFMWKDVVKSWADASSNNFAMKRLSLISLAEGKHKSFKKKIEEVNIIVADNEKNCFLRTFLEKIRTTETYWDNIKFNLHVLEMFKTRDAVKKFYNKNAVDEFTVLDNLKKILRTNFLRDIKVTSEMLHHAVSWLMFEETVKTVDNVLQSYTSNKAETVALKEQKYNDYCKNTTESIDVTDELERLYIARRVFEDSISVAEKERQNIEGNYKEAIKAYDAFIQTCQSVLSNLTVHYGELNDEDFMKLVNAPSGYTDFADFKVGEYEYEEALVRILIDSKVPQSSPSVADVVLHVDIPDTDDRGTVSISDTAAATKVYFNKHYYNSPEVNVVVRGGTTSNGTTVPYIVSTDNKDDRGRYFEVELRNNSGERTTGTISWTSKGY